MPEGEEVKWVDEIILPQRLPWRQFPDDTPLDLIQRSGWPEGEEAKWEATVDGGWYLFISPPMGLL